MLCGEALSPGVCPALRLFVTFAELPQASKWRKWPLRNFRKPQNGKNGPCGTSASLKMGKMAFAELPQASKWRKWPLRNFRKHQNGENGLCGTLPQTPKSFSWHLRDSRKHQNGGNGPCGTSASISKSDFPSFDVRFLAIAWGCTKKAGPAISNRKPCFVYQRKTDAPGERCAVFISSIPRSQPSVHPPGRSRLP